MSARLPVAARGAFLRPVAIFGATASLVGGAILIPKDMSYGADSRFLLTGATLAITGIGLAALERELRSYRARRLRARYAAAGRSMQDTLSYILHERGLAARGRGPLMAGGCLLGTGALLSTWPQCAPLAGLHAPLKVGAVSCAALLAFQTFTRRRHLVNAAYLRQCLRQQAAHIGFRPGARQQAIVAPAGANATFEAGGFAWTFDDLQKNLIIFGGSGSGKTVCVLNAFIGQLVAVRVDDLLVAGLILDPKGVYLDVIKRLCTKAGRADDLVIFSAADWAKAARSRGAIAWNPLDTPDDAVEVAARIIVVMKQSGGLKENQSFFLDSARLFIRHAFVLYREANAPDPASLIDLHRLCAEPTEGALEYRRVLDILAAKFPDAVPAEIEAAVAYFETEWQSLPDAQRSGVRSTTNQLIDDFTADPFAEMITGHSTVRIADVIDEGKILYVHLPLAERERLSRILTTFIKLEFQREILRRVRKPRPSFLFADEYQTIFGSGEEASDTAFFERSRESSHANIVAAQNLSSFLKKTRNREDVMNFLGLCAVKVFLRNTEAETNDWASKLCGERAEIVVTMSEAAQLHGWFSRHHTNYSRATQARRRMPPEAFVDLPIPIEGDPSRQSAGSIVHFATRGDVQVLHLDWPVRGLRS